MKIEYQGNEGVYAITSKYGVIAVYKSYEEAANYISRNKITYAVLDSEGNVDGAYSNKHEAVDHGGEIVELRDMDDDILEHDESEELVETMEEDDEI